MRKLRYRVLAFALAAALTAGTTLNVSAGELQKEVNSKSDTVKAQSNQDENEDYAEGQVIIMYRDMTPTAEIASADVDVALTYTFEDASIEDEDSPELAFAEEDLHVSLIKSDIYTTEQLVEMYSKKSGVIKAEPNYRYHITDDDYTGFQWALDNEGQNGGTAGIDVNADKINDKASSDSKEKVIAVVDTGIDYTHPDLAPVIWNNTLPSNKLKGEHGYDIVNSDADPMDDNGHGTHCSGIMAGAAGDGSGISGIVTSDNVKLMAVKILDDTGSCYGMEIVGGYNYIYRAQQLGVNIVAVNNSWGGGGDESDSIFEELVELVGKAGAISVCAAGNDSSDNDSVPVFPANIDSPYIISVAAVNEKGELAKFSNYGSESVDIAAPGGDILSSVSYDCFNPSIYSDGQKSATCGYFEDFEGVDLPEYKVDVDSSVTSEVELSNEAYFGRTAGKSLKWTIKNAEEDGTYSLIIPYDAKLSNTPVYASAMLRLEDENAPGEGIFSELFGGSVVLLSEGSYENETVDFTELVEINGGYSGNCWNHISGQYAAKIKTASKRALVIQVNTASTGDYTVYLDDLAVSRSDVASGAFGKYDFYNGTSMATPYVTGAVAAIAQAYPEEGALTRKAILLSCSRKTASLTGKVATEGILDFSMIDTPRISVSDIYLNADKNICIEGKFLTGAEVTINGETVTPLSITEDKIIISGSGWLNKNITVVITRGDDSIKRSLYFSDGKTLADEAGILGELIGDEVLSDGNVLYNIGEEGAINVSSGEAYNDPVYMSAEGYEDESSTSWTTASVGYDINIFGAEYGTYVDYSICPNSNAVCTGDGLYYILKFDAGFTTESILANFNQNEGWSKVADIPKAFEEYGNMVLGAYNGKLYLMGGLNEDKMIFGTDVYSYDLITKKWAKEASLPEGRALSKAMQADGRLIVTLGCCDETGKYPVNLIYDGSAWKKSTAVISGMAANDAYLIGEGDDYNVLEYYGGNIGATKSAIMYIGNNADKLGNIYLYNVKNDKYQSSGYSINDKTIQRKTYSGTVHNDKCIMLVNADDDTFSTKQYSISVDSACIKPEVSYDDGGSFDNETHIWLPSDVIRYNPYVSDEYYVVSLKVDGKAVKADSKGKYSFAAPAYQYKDGFTVELSTRPYITEIYADASVSVGIGKSYRIVPGVYPEIPDGASFKWKSSKPKYITVNSKGLVRVSKNAKPGMKATITITAKDGGGASAKVTIKVPSLPKKNSKVKVGNLTYKITKSSKTGGTVSVVKSNNTKLTKVTIPATVNIKGYTFKVTKIEKNAFKSCKKLKKVTIKSSNIKSIGKGAFSTIHKNAAITVPKKQEKKYTRLLKKSGYKGTVKTAKK